MIQKIKSLIKTSKVNYVFLYFLCAFEEIQYKITHVKHF